MAGRLQCPNSFTWGWGLGMVGRRAGKELGKWGTWGVADGRKIYPDNSDPQRMLNPQGPSGMRFSKRKYLELSKSFPLSL